MKTIRVTILLKALSKLASVGAMYSLFQILMVLGEDKPYQLFVMLTMQHWTLLIVLLVGSLFLEILASHPEMRAYFTHIDRSPKGKGRRHLQCPPQPPHPPVSTGAGAPTSQNQNPEEEKKKRKNLPLY